MSTDMIRFSLEKNPSLKCGNKPIGLLCMVFFKDSHEFKDRKECVPAAVEGIVAVALGEGFGVMRQ